MSGAPRSRSSRPIHCARLAPWCNVARNAEHKAGKRRTAQGALGYAAAGCATEVRLQWSRGTAQQPMCCWAARQSAAANKLLGGRAEHSIEAGEEAILGAALSPRGSSRTIGQAASRALVGIFGQDKQSHSNSREGQVRNSR